MISGTRCALLALTILVATVQSLAQRGIAVPVTTSVVSLDIDPVILQLVQNVDSNQVLASLNRLEAFRTRHSSTDSITSARNWLVARFQEYGYSDVVLHSFTWSGRTLHNIIVTKQGRRYPSRFVLLVGHYDSISELPTTLAPGVNDNGSGIALILEIARILSSKQLEYSIRFICFSAEEQGLLGSYAYVNNVVVPENHDIKLLINVDEIGGYRGYTNTMVKVERDEDNNPPGNNEASAAYTDTLAALTRTYCTLATTITEAYGSDYMSFQDRGYVITGFYEGQESPHYHHSTDNVANVDPQYLYQITKAALAGVAYFGGIQRKYLTIRHTPLVDTQDTLHSIQVDAEVSASAPVRSSEVVFRTNWIPACSESAMVPVSLHGDTVLLRGWIPRQSYGTSVSYFLRISSIDSLSATYPPDTLAPLVFAVLPDTIPPGIVHVPLDNRSYYDAPFEIHAVLNDANGIAGAWVTYSINGGPDTTSSLEQLTSDEWRGYMWGSFSPSDRVDYRIQARDRSFSGNIASLPASGRFGFRVLNSLLYDFEASDGSFTPTLDWQWGTIGTPDIPPPVHGQKVWGTNLAGNYSNNTASTLVSPPLDLTGKSDIVLTFKQFYSIEPLNDGGNVAVSMDGGGYDLLVPQGGYPVPVIAALGGPGYSGNSFVWKDARFIAPELANHHARIRFLFKSDLLTAQRGWYLDDVRVDYLDTLISGVQGPDLTRPRETKLSQNYPNPFNPVTRIEFDINTPGRVTLLVFDILGREVAVLVNEDLAAGRYERPFDASRLSSGVYLCRLTSGSIVQTRKLMLVR